MFFIHDVGNFPVVWVYKELWLDLVLEAASGQVDLERSRERK